MKNRTLPDIVRKDTENQVKNIGKMFDSTISSPLEKSLKNHPAWGGKRPGSGRPKTGKKANHFSFRMDEDVKEILSGKKNKSEYINTCIRTMRE